MGRTAAVALAAAVAATPATVQIRTGTAPVCEAVRQALARDAHVFDEPGNAGPIEKFTFKESDEDLPDDLAGAEESRFDFDNDGTPDRVFTKYLENHYIRGSVLLVQRGPSRHDWWFLPCQLDAKRIAFDDCPPFSQKNDEAGFAMHGRTAKERVFFRARYTDLTPFAFAATTFVAVASYSEDTGSYVAVIKPAAGRTYESTCLLQVSTKR